MGFGMLLRLLSTATTFVHVVSWKVVLKRVVVYLVKQLSVVITYETRRICCLDLSYFSGNE